ncbi:4-(cytidine 5'-diphospho)-2-C-methyl-D-erythritol kinase [Lacrimispora amygdalina]|uniref:4-(cytidine 5'-diphospho)-2-C-methyl-D-erythritol kinase n=1 Tax=Lacrimispora amygdalina TaxID=253257 RepID=UPI000BE3D20C|nr:hypothetical protein [Lacrimispora amygdalina]
MVIPAYAKLNLLLNVQSKYINGYHALESIIVPLELCDYLHIELIDNSDEIILKTNVDNVPTDEHNILHKCIQLFKTHYNITSGFNIFLEKNIPIRSGLGGESTDAACMMNFLNQAFNLNMFYSDIFYYGRLLSWDVPICYFQKYIYINDKKSVCEEIDCSQEYYILLIMPNYGISTSEAFDILDTSPYKTVDGSILLESLLQNCEDIGNFVHNSFIKSNPALKSDFYKLQRYCNSLGFDGISMTGTGSCFFMVTHNAEILRSGFTALSTCYPYVYMTKTLANLNVNKSLL